VNAKLLLKMLVYLEAAALIAFVMIFACTFFVAQTCIDQNFVLSSVDVVAVYRIPILLTCRTFPEDIRAKIGFEPTRIDRVNLGFLNAHGCLRL
jgi:hypothetical protein